MVDKHLNKILSFNIKELRNWQGPVEGELDHVVPPDRSLDVMVGVIVPEIKYSWRSFRRQVRQIHA